MTSVAPQLALAVANLAAEVELEALRLLRQRGVE
eukprot:CAMPEP_0184210756 /NCGR_PEP_ID=MMETSP0976-20121227/12775_1 /TAXON_ID=483370 /ORGANISM="non described non described, Strain CCMP2097" /LENGTH=33 /DNA_ID= /DNA_START= /DNA_END= /DNA_ORIENTATION=